MYIYFKYSNNFLMTKKNKSFMKKLKKRFKTPKYWHFHIRKSLLIGLLASCVLLVSNSMSMSYANNTSLMLKNHFKTTTLVEDNTEKMMVDVLDYMNNIQKLEDKYTQIIKSDVQNRLSQLSKDEINNKIVLLDEKIKGFSYNSIMLDSSKKEEFIQLSALRKVIYELHDNSQYSRNIDLVSLLWE